MTEERSPGMGCERQIAIWGAGKVGRGFVADLFAGAGYRVWFVDADVALVRVLNERGSYTVRKVPADGTPETTTVTGYLARHVSDERAAEPLLHDCSLVAVAVFPSAFDQVAASLAGAVEARAREPVPRPMDVLLCTNILHPSARFRELLESRLTERGKAYLAEKVGLVDTLVIRIAVDSTPEDLRVDPLVVVTNGYDELPADALAFRGPVPRVPGLLAVQSFVAEETRKLYTYNMVHAVYAYVGRRAGCRAILECIRNPTVSAVAHGALDEASRALQAEFGFSAGDMDAWNRRVLTNVGNPVLQDTCSRLGADPARKLKRDDRLTGAALLCRRHGVMPHYLSHAIACALLFDDPEDPSAADITAYVAAHGAKEAISRYCGLKAERDLIQLIADQHAGMQASRAPGDAARTMLVRKAYELGFRYERAHKGCAQCALLAIFEVSGKQDDGLFQAASGLSGGTGLCGDGPCGAYVGGVLAMGSFVGRRRARLAEGDKEAQYASYEMAQKLHDRFVEAYGAVTCRGVHESVFGRWYPLRNKSERVAFEDAGAHVDKCTCVVASACAWVTEILMDAGCLAPDRP